MSKSVVLFAACAALLVCSAAGSSPLKKFFSTGKPDLKLAINVKIDQGENEAADDFVLKSATRIRAAAFNLLLTNFNFNNGDRIKDAQVVIYRLFGADSELRRVFRKNTPGHVFADNETPCSLTRNGSPGDDDFILTSLTEGGISSLNVLATKKNEEISVGNTIEDSPGFFCKPFENTGGDGPLDGRFARVVVRFDDLRLEPGHYFMAFKAATTKGKVYWLSAPKPGVFSAAGGALIKAPAKQFDAVDKDLQTWARDLAIVPDWQRVGDDVGAGLTNMSFDLYK